MDSFNDPTSDTFLFLLSTAVARHGEGAGTPQTLSGGVAGGGTALEQAEAQVAQLKAAFLAENA